jgi:hypothetical protein
MFLFKDFLSLKLMKNKKQHMSDFEKWVKQRNPLVQKNKK